MAKGKGLADGLERLASRIPGLRTYRSREDLRENDKKIREHLASRLQESRSQLQRSIRDLSVAGKTDPLAAMDRLSSHFQQMADTLRYAPYGFSGVFDLEKIRDAELERLRTFDLGLADDLEGIQAGVKEAIAAAAESRTEKIARVDALLDSLEAKFQERKDFLSRPE